MADLNFCNYVVGGPTSAPLKSTGLIVDLAGNVTVGVSFPAHLAGGVTVGTAPSAVAEVAPSADLAEVVSSIDLAGDVTTGVASSLGCC